MNRKIWLSLFFMLVAVYLGYSILFGDGALWVRLLGLAVIILWFCLTPLFPNEEKGNLKETGTYEEREG
ncbi:hypothetical protein NCCP2716_28380 [Sporosarcina sp. NCCP-2716]|uniref:hypothetical protein n=1 Tax=Sporosarcina sp. NCCP-2716 TaxID=2943679 RepID=UPI00203B9011|nr:hypothetical protein [Sporosarcina sp. NCCP-2716]GKV70340.1 hypothetical protein NCCP2716_28380 [Sporosarcina sp. NCCP-2716]